MNFFESSNVTGDISSKTVWKPVKAHLTREYFLLLHSKSNVHSNTNDISTPILSLDRQYVNGSSSGFYKETLKLQSSLSLLNKSIITQYRIPYSKWKKSPKTR